MKVFVGMKELLFLGAFATVSLSAVSADAQTQRREGGRNPSATAATPYSEQCYGTRCSRRSRGAVIGGNTLTDEGADVFRER